MNVAKLLAQAVETCLLTPGLELDHPVGEQAVVDHHSRLVTDPALQQTMVELAPLINDNDLMLASFGLNVCRSLLLQRPDTASAMAKLILKNAVGLAGSPVIQVRPPVAPKVLYLACALARLKTKTN